MGIMSRSKIIEISMGRLGIWKLKGTVQPSPQTLSFSEKEQMEFQSIKNTQRQKEYLAVRQLLQEMTGVRDEIHYDDRGKPRLKNSPLQISISHSSDLVVVLLSACSAGVDTEHIQRKVQSVTKRFLSDEELYEVKQAINPQLSGIAYWSAKEAAFKCAALSDIEFKTHIAVFPFELQPEGGIFHGELRKNTPAVPVTFYYFFFENNLIVYCVEQTEKTGQRQKITQKPDCNEINFMP
jgi:4'-phosphopantetheinyl transferase